MQYNPSSLQDYKSGLPDSYHRRKGAKGLRWALLGAVSGLALGFFSLTSYDANALRVKELPLSLPAVTEIDSQPAEITTVPVAALPQAEPAAAIEPEPPGSWHEVTVRSGDSLARIFSKQSIPPRQLHDIIASGKIAKKLTNIYPGQTLRMRTTPQDGLLELRYEIDALNQIQVTRNDAGFAAELIVREPERRSTHATGTIDNSLFLAAQQAKLPENRNAG